MKLKLLLLSALIILAFACKNEDSKIPEPEPEQIDEDYFFAFSVNQPAKDMLFDTINNRVYIFGPLGGRIICYDYDKFEVVADVSVGDFFVDHNIALGRYNGETEIYLSEEGRIIYIRDGNTLALKDSIVISEFEGSRKVASLEFREPDLIFIGPGNTSSFDDNGSIAYSRSTKTYLSGSEIGDSHLRITTYIEKANPEIINVIGISYQTSHPRIMLDKYDSSGMILENNIDFSADESVGHRLLKTSNNAPYFISSSNGNIFLKDGLAYTQSIGDLITDVVINDNGEKIYALSYNNRLDIFAYPDLNLLESIDLKERAIRGFIDEQKLILVYFQYNIDTELDDIHISKLDVL